MHELVAKQADTCEPEWVGAEHPLFILYTSGSTGKPKGVQHSSGGYLLWAILTMRWTFDIKPTDIFWCTADIGWVTGPHLHRLRPARGRRDRSRVRGRADLSRRRPVLEDDREAQGLDLLHGAHGDPRADQGSGVTPSTAPTNYDLSSLRLLGTVGEPINPEAWMWYHENVGGGRCPIVDTWWQTETGGHMITPLPGVTPLVPGSCTLPLPGIMAAIVDETGHDVENGHGGILVIKRPWPAMIRTIWGDPERYQKSYYPEELGGKLYLAGDGSVRDKTHGYFTIMGRIDDVLNVSGHRLGTMEIESALVANPLVAEAAVVGRPDDMTGEAVCAFVVLKQARPQRRRRREDREGAARLGRQGDRPDRQAQGHPLRRQPAEDALRQDHAAAAALDRQGRGDHAGRLDAGESGDSRAAEADALIVCSAACRRVLGGGHAHTDRRG